LSAASLMHHLDGSSVIRPLAARPALATVATADVRWADSIDKEEPR
jgi:hypothetical protein